MKNTTTVSSSSIISHSRPPGVHRRFRPLAILAASIAGLLAETHATDAIKTWDAGASGNNNFFNTNNWNPNGTPTFTGNTDAIVFDGLQAAGNPTITLNITGGLTSYLVKSFTFGSDPLNNSYAFAYTFNGPQTLILGDATTGGTAQANTGFLTNNSSGTQTFNLASNASTVLPFQIGFSFGGINAAVGNFTFGANTKIDIGNESAAAGRDVLVTGAGNTTINGTLVGLGDDLTAGGTLTKTGTGTLFLNGDSTAWNGRLTITEGTAQVNKTNSLGTALGRTTISGGAATGRLAITGGINVAEPIFIGGRTSAAAPAIINLSGSNTLVTGPVTLEAGGAEYGLQSDGGTLHVQSPITYGTATGPTTLNLLGAGNGVIASDLGALPISVVKAGAGTWTLSGAANAYTGTTTVNEGRLNVSTTQSGGGAIVVGDTATLGVTLSGAGQSLQTSSLTLGGTLGGTLTVDLGSFGNPAAAVVNAASLVINGANIISLKAGGLGVGQFSLIDYSGTIAGGSGFGGLALGGLPARISANLVHDTVDTRILVNVTAFDIPKWIGGTNGDWDIDDGSGTGTSNWREAGSGNLTRYLQGAGGTDSVLFDDTAGVPTNVNLTTMLTPASITINASTNAVTFSGSGKLSGTTGLLKQGTSTLTLLNTGGNDYSGTTTIAAGAIQLGDGSTAGAGQLGTGPIINHGSLVLNRPDSFTIASDLSGVGTLTKQSPGTVTLSGNNSAYTGAVTVAGGTLRLGSVNALAGAASVNVQDAAALDLGGRALGTGQAVTIIGAGPNGAGSLVNTGTGGATVGIQKLTLAGDAVIGGTGRFDVHDQDGGLNAAGHSLTKLGTNTIFLSNLGETHLGSVTINAGRLSFAGNTTFGDQAGSILVNGGELGFEDSTVPLHKAVQFNGGRIVFPNGDLNHISSGVTLLDVDPTSQAPVVNTFQGVATLTVSGPISGPGGLVKSNGGALILTGANSYGGTTTISGGVLRANEGTSLGANALLLNGGVLESGINITRALGVDAGFISIAGGNSGFSAAGGNVIVDLSGNGASSGFTIVWGDNPDFLPTALVLNAATATHDLVFANNLHLNGAGRTINVNASTATITGALSGIGGGLTKGGAGTLVLPVANTYTAGTTVTGGTLRVGHAQALGAAPAPLTVNGATVDLNGHSLTVTSLAGNSGGLITDNSATAGTTRLVAVSPSGNSTYTGSIADGANGRVLAFEKSGEGTLIFNKANAHTYTGDTVISGGRLEVRTNNAQVLPNGTDVTFTGSATLAAVNNAAAASASLTLGQLAFQSGEATIETNKLNASALDSITTFAAVPSRSAGATANFTLINSTDPSVFKVAFATAPQTGQSLNGGIYFRGTDFAAYDAAGYVRGVNYATDANGADVILAANQATLGVVTDKDVQLSGVGFGITAQSSETLRTLKTAGSSSLTLEAGATLTLSNGGLLASGGVASISGGAGLTTGGAGDLAVRVEGASDEFTIATAILPSTTGGLTKSGDGTLHLGGINAFTGGISVNGGTLAIDTGGSVANAGSIELQAGTSLVVNATLSGVTSLLVESGATLGGSGNISGNGIALEPGANLAAGSSGGTLTFALGSSALDLSSAADAFGYLQFELGSTSDRVVLASGTLNLGSVVDFDDFFFTDLGGFGPGTYVLFDTATDILGSLGPNSTGNLFGWEAALGFANGANGRDDLVLTVVPEPGTAALLMGGLGLLAGARRRARR